MHTRTLIAALGIASLFVAACGDDDDAATDATPAAEFVSPSTGDALTNPVTVEARAVNAEVVAAADSSEGEGHFHVIVDADCVDVGEPIPKDATHVHVGDGSTTFELPELEAGEHTLCLQLGDGTHTAFGDTSTVTVTVE